MNFKPTTKLSSTNLSWAAHTVILPDRTLKKWGLSNFASIARNSSAPNVKRIFEILWGILEGRTNSARPSRPCLKNCQNGTFWSVHGIWNFLGQMTSFEVLLKCHPLTFSKKCLRHLPALSIWEDKWIISKIPRSILKILFVYCSYEFLAMLESKIRKAPLSKGSRW